MRRFPIILVAVAAVMIAAACETDLTPTIAHIGVATNVGTSPRESLSVSPSLVQLSVGQSAQLFTNAPDTLRKQLVWTSQIPTIAAVSQSGLVTAGTPGTTIVTVRYSFDTTNTASATVQVFGPVAR
jgi:uncharacterized protein YjdB